MNISDNTPEPQARIEIDSGVFNPFSPDFIRHPRETWQRLLREYPIAWHKELQMWIVNSHELCDKLLKNNQFTPSYRAWEFAPPEK